MIFQKHAVKSAMIGTEEGLAFADTPTLQVQTHGTKLACVSARRVQLWSLGPQPTLLAEWHPGEREGTHRCLQFFDFDGPTPVRVE